LSWALRVTLSAPKEIRRLSRSSTQTAGARRISAILRIRSEPTSGRVPWPSRLGAR
jgi:hypothetical protein